MLENKQVPETACEQMSDETEKYFKIAEKVQSR